MNKEKLAALTITQEIERSIIKTYRSRLWAKFVKAIKDYNLLKPGDHIAVCMSGGKDSALLAKLFQEMLRHPDFDFKVTFILMDPGYSLDVLNIIKENLQILNIEASIHKTNIFSIVKSQKSGMCYVCAKMRRGALYKIAQDLGCNKIALGHHYDDVIETTLMNMLNTGSIQTMLPKLHSDNYANMELIRPMYLIRENDINKWVKHNNLSFISCSCPMQDSELIINEKSKRLQTKLMIKDLVKYNENVEKNLFKATDNINLNMVLGYKKDNIYHSYYDTYEKEDH